ncbi:MAG TPA: alkaline phosphatase family protein [Candidatus Cybelea sp.]
MVRLAALAASLAWAACSSNAAFPALPSARSTDFVQAANATGKIRHVVWIVQENRSFNDLFEGYPGARTSTTGKDSHGDTITLHPVPLTTVYEIDHSAFAMFSACDGKGELPGTKCRMDGFDLEREYGSLDGQYAYVPRSETKPYWAMAHEWALADKMFASQLDESFVAHQYIIAAQADSSVDVPMASLWGCGGPKSEKVETINSQRKYSGVQRPCFDYTTLGDELDKAGLTWRFYTCRYRKPLSGYWSGYQAVRHIFHGPDWKTNILTPQKKFLSDVRSGKLASMTWITPLCPDSDHPLCGGGFGPSWVSSVVNAVGESKFWSTTAIFVQWDDWGGWYDPVPPPFRDYDGLGFRVPLIVISPYAKQNYVSHVQYETASVLRFTEDVFALQQLAASDTRASSPAGDCFDFTQMPRKFVPIQAPHGESFFLHQAADPRIPDEE